MLDVTLKEEIVDILQVAYAEDIRSVPRPEVQIEYKKVEESVFQCVESVVEAPQVTMPELL